MNSRLAPPRPSPQEQGEGSDPTPALPFARGGSSKAFALPFARGGSLESAEADFVLLQVQFQPPQQFVSTKCLNDVAAGGIQLLFGTDRLDGRNILRLIVQQLQPVFQRVAFREDLVFLVLHADGLLQVV